MLLLGFSRKPKLFRYYLDSVNGSDANDGKSIHKAFQTEAALRVVLSSGDSVGILRGSSFLEQFGASTGTLTNIKVQAIGAGAMPIFDGRDVASSGGWAKTAGLTNVYDRTWSHDTVTGSFISLWEDDVRLRWVSSQATCDATPGSYTVATTSGSSTQLYYHPTGSGNPASNGKVVKLSKRLYGLRSYQNWSIRGIHTKCQLHNDGSLIVGVDSYARDCLAEDGTKHNVFLNAGAKAKNVGAWKSDWHDRTNTTMFVGYTDNGVGKTVTFEDCWSVNDAAKVTTAIAAAAGLDGFYAHNANGTDIWDTVTYRNCSVKNAVTAFSAAAPSHLRSYSCKVQGALDGFVVSSPDAIVNDFWVSDTADFKIRASIQCSTGTTATIDGLRCYTSRGADNRGDVYIPSASTTVTVQNSVIYRVPGSTGVRWGINVNNASGVGNSNNNIIQNVTTTDIAYRRVGTGSADNNNYYPNTTNFFIGATNYNDFAAYKAAETALDQASTTHDPQFVDPANGDWTIGNATLSALGIGLDRDITSQQYTALPSDVEIGAL